MQQGDEAAGALLRLLEALDAAGYSFVPVTPASHERVIARPDKKLARDLRDVFGWSLPFERELLPSEMLEALQRADALEEADGLLKSRIRVGRLCDRLILHSAFPTDERDAVFFSPDTHRFVAFLRSELRETRKVRQLVDIGAGPGSGALCAASSVPGARLTLCDINPKALSFAALNARHAGIAIETVLGGIDAVEAGFDLAIANPPFMVDEDGRSYRDGGDLHGGRMSVDWADAAMAKLAPGGRLLLYTGVAIVDGADPVREALERTAARRGCAMRYEEIDPDIYGEELSNPPYADVERIAAVGAVFEKERSIERSCSSR